MEQKLLFLIDDDRMVQKLIESEFRSLNFELKCFSYGEEALKNLSLNPDLIILDYFFVKGDETVMGGPEILIEIRKINKTVPVVMLSGQDSGRVVLELIKMGIEEYVIKEDNFVGRLKEVVTEILN